MQRITVSFFFFFFFCREADFFFFLWYYILLGTGAPEASKHKGNLKDDLYDISALLVSGCVCEREKEGIKCDMDRNTLTVAMCICSTWNKLQSSESEGVYVGQTQPKNDFKVRQ